MENDVFAVQRGHPDAPSRTPRRTGPYLLECKTFRMTGTPAQRPADELPAHLFRGMGRQGPH